MAPMGRSGASPVPPLLLGAALFQAAWASTLRREEPTQYTLLHFNDRFCGDAQGMQCQVLVPAGCGMGSCCLAGDHYVKVVEIDSTRLNVTGGDSSCSCLLSEATNHGSFTIGQCDQGVKLVAAPPAELHVYVRAVLSSSAGARHCNGIAPHPR
ncbi:unnamed protein product [Prorocentrum cordatum]|uniref:Uncharacterized protein n=1 Tax=Prorocentrum cordatum TaxID=2364126 RepID=A0ABN9RCS2_9DINO|nr:unnamed protein product [Polarella glacialis]